MIFATWSTGKGFHWMLKVPKDKFWGKEQPREDDEVMVLKKSGACNIALLGAQVSEDRFAWYFNENKDPYGAIDESNDGGLSERWAHEHFACGDKD